MLPHFFQKDIVKRSRCLSFRGGLVLQEYADLRNRLIADIGREAAALFAEPVVTVKDEAVEIAWYCEQASPPCPLASLDAAHSAAAREALSRLLASVAPLLQSDIGPLLGRALYLHGAGDIMAVGSSPLLVRWGMVPDAAIVSDQHAASQHFAATIGPFASFAAPPISSAPRPPTQGDATANGAATAGRKPAHASVPARPAAATGLVVSEHRPVVIAAVASAAIALLLTLPGILAFPTGLGLGGDDGALARAREITRAMKEKVGSASRALEDVDCNKDGSISPKNGSLPPTLPIRSGPAAPGGKDGDMALVSRRATDAVVFIFTCNDEQTIRKASKNAGNKLTPCPMPAGAKDQPGTLYVQGWGSGFFIAPNLVATNTHVVENAAAVLVASRSFGHIAEGKVEAATHKEHADDPDFAVVRVDAAGPPEPIELAATATRLQNVVSAGYPGVITEQADAQLERLFGGDPKAAPELVTFPGFVTLVLNQDQPVPLIISSATIGHGNSGGPLLDLCGRAVGVNTLGWSGKETDSGYKVNVAESATALSAFLKAHNVPHKLVGTSCQPGAQADSGGSSAPPAK